MAVQVAGKAEYVVTAVMLEIRLLSFSRYILQFMWLMLQLIRNTIRAPGNAD
ncbi:hypothetical protein GO755_15235 [Spirosoma sp. HMF4905]|uniref:Uncharacterized protein n=1 Tax=Spirosoma arboris TaxID=2682092 RepID=A0A7K1SC64_9BACT|nr:hypothetical protein [Spirosoma arboris]MVM31397.1 hypothetical protein [Spirosoma arboris]